MTTTETPAFICTVCACVIREAHVPPTAPKCSSCGATTKPNAAMRARAGNVTCHHCGNVQPAYKHTSCPECGTIYCTFATNR